MAYKRDLSFPLSPSIEDDKKIHKKNRKQVLKNIEDIRKKYSYQKTPGHNRGYAVKRTKPLVYGALTGVATSMSKKFKK